MVQKVKDRMQLRDRNMAIQKVGDANVIRKSWSWRGSRDYWIDLVNLDASDGKGKGGEGRGRATSESNSSGRDSEWEGIEKDEEEKNWRSGAWPNHRPAPPPPTPAEFFHFRRRFFIFFSISFFLPFFLFSSHQISRPPTQIIAGCVFLLLPLLWRFRCVCREQIPLLKPSSRGLFWLPWCGDDLIDGTFLFDSV